MIPAFKRSLRFSAIAASETPRSAVISFLPTGLDSIFTSGTELRRESMNSNRINPPCRRLQQPVQRRMSCTIGQSKFKVLTIKLQSLDNQTSKFIRSFGNILEPVGANNPS